MLRLVLARSLGGAAAPIIGFHGFNCCFFDFVEKALGRRKKSMETNWKAAMCSNLNCCVSNYGTCGGLIVDTATARRARRRLPRCRPCGLFLGGLCSGMKTRFILITHWNLDFYRIPQLGDDSSWRETHGSRGQPRFLIHDCLFGGHDF